MPRWLQIITVVALVGVAVFVSGGFHALQAQSNSPMVTLTADGVVRAWPDHRVDSIGTVPARSSVPANGRTPDSQWWRIPYPGGPNGNGWLPANVVQPNQAAANVPVIEVIFATATPEPIPPTPTPPSCLYNAAYVTDVTIADHTQVPAAQQFDKVWRMSNTGSCSWEQGTSMVFVSGFKMNAPDAVAIPVTAPGATADIGVTMFAPSSPGSYSGVWQLRDPQGQFFGSKVTVVVDVPNPNPPGPAPTPAPPPPPQPSQPYINFWSDTDRVNPGQCTNIHWDVRNVRDIYLEYGGHTQGVTGQGTQWVCPSSDGKRYVLHVDMVDGSRQDRELVININSGPPPAPTPTRKPSNRWVNASVNPTTISKGQCTTLTWEVGDFHKLYFDQQWFWDAKGTYQYCPKETTKSNFTVCYDPDCHDRKDVQIKVEVK